VGIDPSIFESYLSSSDGIAHPISTHPVHPVEILCFLPRQDFTPRRFTNPLSSPLLTMAIGLSRIWALWSIAPGHQYAEHRRRRLAFENLLKPSHRFSGHYHSDRDTFVPPDVIVILDVSEY
jgi:hypothetical protein